MGWKWEGFLFIESPCQFAVIKHGDFQAVGRDGKIFWRFCLGKSLQEDKSHKCCGSSLFPSARGGGLALGQGPVTWATLGTPCLCPQVSPTPQGQPESGKGLTITEQLAGGCLGDW